MAELVYLVISLGEKASSATGATVPDGRAGNVDPGFLSASLM